MNEAQRRKNAPVFSGVLRYFPKALWAVAELSRIGNEQHNPGKPLHWDRSKSGDELDALTRHLIQAGTLDTDGVRHSVKVAWRALASLEKELEQAQVWYISGKITDTTREKELENMAKFAVVQQQLLARGERCFNPAELETEGWTWEQYLSRDLLWITQNHPRMYMMKGWDESKGARLEHALAKELHLNIFYEE